MANRGATSPSRSIDQRPLAPARRSLAPSQSWQLPLLLFSLALFGYAAYLFIDPKPGPSVDERIEAARIYLRQDRGEAAIEVLNKLLKTEQLVKEKQGAIHLLLARSLEAAQREKRIDLVANHEQIVKQTLYAVQCEIPLESADYRRMGDAYERLNKPTEALANFRKALALDVDHELALHRKVIELLVDDNQTVSAHDELDRYLKIPDVADTERSWAMGLKAQLLIDAGKFTEARVLLDRAERLSVASDSNLQGNLAYRLGYAAWKVGENDEAERQFLMARELLGVGDPLDADAAYALGKIALARKELDQASVYFQSIIVSHPDSKLAPLAQMERGIVRATRGEDAAALEDLNAVVKRIDAREQLSKLREPALAVLREAGAILTGRSNYAGAIELMAREQTLAASPAPEFFHRLAIALESRARQVDAEAANAEGVEQLRKQQEARAMMTRAGHAYVAHARKIEPTDEVAYGESLWKGIDCFDRSGDAPASIDALELFAADRPRDPLAADALLRLGRTYQAVGAFDKAIAAFTRVQADYPNSLAASKAAVPMAEALLAKGPENNGLAEKVLMSVVDENRLVTPDSNEFRQALFELGTLCYRTGRYDAAIARLENFVERYPDDPRQAQLKFIMADSYRKSAASLGERLALIDAGKVDPTADGRLVDRVEMVVARRDRLRKARALFDNVVDAYRDGAPAAEIDQMYLKLAHFYRADCLFDLMEYAEAIALYDAAARRYQNDPSALAAYVQIVNAYVALDRPTEARAANERAKWMLKRIPPEAFDAKTFNVSRQYWEQWLAFAGESGLWAKQMASGN
jgi:tetratricopeptide (TPR) repeat protein